MSLFKRTLTRSATDISTARATRLERSAKNEYNDTLRKYQKEMDEMDETIERMQDMSSSPDMNIDNRAVDFNAEAWVTKLCDTEIKKSILQAKIKIVIEQVGKYFEEETEPEA
jgi:hypothetical protein